MFKLSIILVAVALVQTAFSSSLPVNKVGGSSLIRRTTEGNIPVKAKGSTQPPPTQPQGPNTPDTTTQAANDDTYALAARFLVDPNEHTGLADLADHLGTALGEAGEGLEDLL